MVITITTLGKLITDADQWPRRDNPTFLARLRCNKRIICLRYTSSRLSRSSLVRNRYLPLDYVTSLFLAWSHTHRRRWQIQIWRSRARYIITARVACSEKNTRHFKVKRFRARRTKGTNGREGGDGPRIFGSNQFRSLFILLIFGGFRTCTTSAQSISDRACNSSGQIQSLQNVISACVIHL